MFESRMQLAQAILAPAAILTGVAILLFIKGPLAVAIFCLALGHAGAAVGLYFYADCKGYPGVVGVPLGIAFGILGGVILLMLPDETVESEFARQRRLGREGIENARRRDKGYEVLDDDEDD